ncbi:hypothetical protein AXX17_AT5G41770 [Arabidopsis thaliana]|uniref:Uncharacterized protein n=1 Tax=Arabidopsis thaliana TaxID=3702 RepID=A0A178U977_ARATH|nr:hypothetical protein AXX17_AT5G41770 [Arabidopsis thaliana]
MPFESVYCIAGEVGICLLTFGIRPRPSPSSVMQQLGTSAVTSKFKQTFFFKMRHFLDVCRYAWFLLVLGEKICIQFYVF